MSVSLIGLLLGLFAGPAVLLQVGHRLRDRTHRAKRAFWGGVIGHSLGAVISMSALMLPPIHWDESGMLRAAAAHWAMALLLVMGVIAGAVSTRGPEMKR